MLNSILTTPVTFTGLILTLLGALVFGTLSALVFSWRKPLSSSLSVTLVVLPVAMSMVVVMINGNLGMAVAVAGGFTLVRFRSIAGTGKEISAVFVVMTLGVICGMGYLGIAAIFFAVIALLVIVLTLLHFGEGRNEKLLRVTIPEDYDYEGLLDDVFAKYDMKATVDSVRTTNMGSLIDVTYRVSLQGETVPKAMLDDVRARNGNLGVVVRSASADREQL